MNLRNLERVLAREEEVKKRAIVHKAVYTGPQMRYISKNGKFSSLLKSLSANFCFLCRCQLDTNSFSDDIFISIGCSYLEFSKGLSFQSEISTKSGPCKSTKSYVFMSILDLNNNRITCD